MTITKAIISSGVLIAVLALVLVVVRWPDQESGGDAAAAQPAAKVDPGFLYGRITADGTTYEGRLRWGGDQEAFWGDYFNGRKGENPWAVHLPRDPSPFEIFGFEIGRDRSINLDRLFLARFGDIARIEAHFRDAQVRLKSGATFTLDRFAAGDIDDGVRVWDRSRGVVDIDARSIRTIEFLSTVSPLAGSDRLHGTVRTRQGNFTGYIQCDGKGCVGTDELEGRTAGREQRLRYDTIRSIARQSRDRALVTLLDGREVALSSISDVGDRTRRFYVDEPRYGRVLISWDALERVDFSPGGSGPAYNDFPAGRALAGRVTTRDGRRLTGRLVYDFDESQTTETLDTTLHGVDYNIPFGLVGSIVPRDRDGNTRRAIVILQAGEELQLEHSGDLGEQNAGVLVFVDGRQRPDYVPWADVDRIDFERPPAMYPPIRDR